MEGQWGQREGLSGRPAHPAGTLLLWEGLRSPDIITCRGREPHSKINEYKQMSHVNSLRETESTQTKGDDSSAK